jgi:cell wall-associated NlpC family hydrolase
MRTAEVFFLRMIDGMLAGLRTLTGFMGHLPGPLGAPFRAASAAIDGTRDHIHKLISDLTQVHSKAVSITVDAAGHYSVSAAGGHRITSQWTGGPVRGPGGPTDDKAGLYALSNKEWVIRANSAARYGDKAMAAVNRGDATILHRGMATGGRVSGGYTGTPQGLGAFDLREYNATVKLVEDLTAKGAKKAMMGAGWGRGAGRKLVNLLRPYVGKVPYVWGGTSPAGWDCSGMTLWGLKHANGISAPRTSESQYAWVRRVNDQVGALAFFVSPAGGAPPGHVGVSMGNGSMINAAGTLSGTTISGTGGAMGFGVPPGAVGMAAGGKAGKSHPDPQRKRWLAQLARDVKVLEAARKAAAHRRKILRHSVEIDQLWFLTHPGVRKGGIGWNEHQRALRNDSRRLRLFNKRETAKETLLAKKIALLRDLTGFPRGRKYGGPGSPGPDPGTE